MKIKLEVFSTEALKGFLINLNDHFDLTMRSFSEIEKFHDKKNLSLVFLEDNSLVSSNIIKTIYQSENYIFVCKDFSIFQKYSLNQKNSLIGPVSINSVIDLVKNIENTKKHIFLNIELNNHVIINIKTKEKMYLTQAENLILLKLFRDKNVKKRDLERDALQIKQNLNTSSIESHLNRIRKKLKKIISNFTISSREKHVYLENINQDT